MNIILIEDIQRLRRIFDINCCSTGSTDLSFAAFKIRFVNVDISVYRLRIHLSCFNITYFDIFALHVIVALNSLCSFIVKVCSVIILLGLRRKTNNFQLLWRKPLIFNRVDYTTIRINVDLVRDQRPLSVNNLICGRHCFICKIKRYRTGCIFVPAIKVVIGIGRYRSFCSTVRRKALLVRDIAINLCGRCTSCKWRRIVRRKSQFAGFSGIIEFGYTCSAWDSFALTKTSISRCILLTNFLVAGTRSKTVCQVISLVVPGN